MELSSVHHIAIIVSDYDRAMDFYRNRLGFAVVNEVDRPERGDRIVNLRVSADTQLELFVRRDPPARVTDPEAAGLRHLAFRVADVPAAARELAEKGIAVEPVRTEASGARFTFFRDPDGLPIELHE